MSIISAGTTSGTALVNTGNTTGTLVFQTNGTTTALTLGTDQSATFAGALVSPTITTPTINTPTITAPTITGYTETVVVANTGTAYTINIVNGTVQILTLTGNCTYTFPTPTAGKSFTLLQLQDATGSRTVTWAASVKWPSSTSPTITGTASKGDKFVFTADGTYWWGSVAGQNYL